MKDNQNSLVINIIVPLVLLLFAIPTLISWDSVNVFARVSAIIAAITGAIAVFGLIIRLVAAKRLEKYESLKKYDKPDASGKE
jgi:membrane protein DedA with SNARE-associated domain